MLFVRLEKKRNTVPDLKSLYSRKKTANKNNKITMDLNGQSWKNYS